MTPRRKTLIRPAVSGSEGDVIYLMRHGESPVNVTRTLSYRRVDPPLTENGAKQAEQAAAWLADKPIQRLYASPMARAVQTAQIAGQRLELDYTVAEELREVDCGVLEGRSDAQAWETFQQVIVRWFTGDHEARCEGGETGRHAGERFVRFVHSLPDAQGDVLAVGHGGIFAWGVMQLCYDLKPESAWELYLPPTGLVLVDRTSYGYSCVKWGLDEHLGKSSITDVPEELQEQ